MMKPTPDPEPGTNPYDPPTSRLGYGSTPVSTAPNPWLLFGGMGIVSGVFCWLFWSVFMSIAMRKDLVSILIGPGAAFGLTMGLFFGAMWAFLGRSGTISFPIKDQVEFLPRLDQEMAKMRCHPLVQEDGYRRYAPKALLRMPAFDIHASFGPDMATLVGPKMTIGVIKKKLTQ